MPNKKLIIDSELCDVSLVGFGHCPYLEHDQCVAKGWNKPVKLNCSDGIAPHVRHVGCPFGTKRIVIRLSDSKGE